MSFKITVLLILSIIGLTIAIYFYTQGNSQIEVDNKEVPKLHMPVEGIWKLVKSPGHDTYAFDLVKVDSISYKKLVRSRFQHILGNVKTEDSYSWIQPIYSPIEGVVVRSSNDNPDRQQLSLLKDLWNILFNKPNLNVDDLSPFAGNHVIIKGDEYYVFLAHLKQNSLKVSQGDKVEAGKMIGRVGNSGVTLEPHLHFQLFDQIDNLKSAKAPPFHITRFERWRGGKWEKSSNEVLQKGDLVRFQK